MVGLFKVRVSSSRIVEAVKKIDIVETYGQLTAPPTTTGDLRFSAQSLPELDAYRIGKNSDSHPALLISVTDPGSRALIDYRLENLDITHGVGCVVVHPDGTQEYQPFSVVRCLSNDSEVQDMFLHSIESMVVAIGSHPTAADVSRGIAKLVEIFRLMGQAPRKTIQGLWAELLVIAEARDPEQLARAWHVTFLEMYDFNRGGQRIEVKSAIGQRRQHHFSLAQLRPPPGATVLVASVLVQRAGQGHSVIDLASEVKNKLGNGTEVLSHVDEVVAEALGNSWRRAGEYRFDREGACHSLTFFFATDIPKVELQLPPEVSNVHFEVDLSGVPSATRTDIAAAGGLFGAAVPGR